MDYYLKFTDEAEATSVLYTDDMPNFPNIDTIGTIYQPTGQINEEGNPVMAPIAGWYVNVRCEETTAFDNYQVDPAPASPVRVWA
jgi:hypothetical protein